jgi:hypothetical protein
MDMFGEELTGQILLPKPKAGSGFMVGSNAPSFSHRSGMNLSVSGPYVASSCKVALSESNTIAEEQVDRRRSPAIS